MATALTHYLTSTAATTVTTANTALANATTGAATTSKNTTVGTATGWGDEFTQGTLNAWAASGSVLAPSVNAAGAIDDSTIMEGNQYVAGSWTATVKLNTNSGTVVADLHVKAYQRSSGGTYTLIADMVASGQSITTSVASYSLTVTTGANSGTFATGDKTYYQYTWNITSGGASNTVIKLTESSSSSVGSTSAQVVTPGFQAGVTTSTRTIPASAALQSTLTRTIPDTAALQSTLTRTIPASAALQATLTRTIPASASLSGGSSRTIPASAALQSTLTRTIPATAALVRVRTIPTSAALLSTLTRTIPTSAALQSTLARVIPASVALTVTSTRTIPASAALYLPSVFYASNVAQTAGGLTQSDQMSQVLGGTETSFTVTAPSSGTNSYLELVSQGGTPGATPALPVPTGKGWSISLAGNTILAGNWFSTFTLAKSGTAKSGASLFVRWYRRTIDGVYYPIGAATLSAQTFNTTKTVYITPSVFATLWQFIAGDTLYMDAFVFNGATAWASDVFTVYVSNSATLGVSNDGTTTAPQMIATPAGLSNYTGASSFQTGATLPVLNSSFTLADAIDQRSILSTTGEDVAGNLSFVRGMPVIFSDHDQGVLYTGAVNSDRATKPAAGNSSAQLEHALTYMDNHYLVDKRANTTNYLNWSAGDMACDFIQQTLSQESVTGQFALESDYTPTTFSQGTLAGVVATTNTTPFVYAPNVATPPVTSNTGDLELTAAGSPVTITESTTSDFSGGTLAGMVAGGNSLKPTTVSAIRLQAQLPLQVTAGSTNTSVEIWSGSQVVGTNDTLNYDIFVSSTSPAFNVGVDLLFSDGTLLSSQTSGVFDQNGVLPGGTADLSGYAKDTWYTRNVVLTPVHGKTINQVLISLGGSQAGLYTIFVKNCYLGSASGSPFFSTTATATNVNPPVVTLAVDFISSLIVASVVSVWDPALSSRVSPAHSIDAVKLVRSSNIAWTASLPTTGTPGMPTTTTGTSPQAVLYASYDGTTWLPCTNNAPLPGLPAGANVAGTSLYLMETFTAGSDPTAIPALLNVNITLQSAANATTSDVVAAYGAATAWNTGTFTGTAVNGSGDLVLGTISRDWNDNVVSNQTLFPATYGATESASSGAYVLTQTGPNGPVNGSKSRFNFGQAAADFTLDIDIKFPSGTSTGILYRTTWWDGQYGTEAYGVYMNSTAYGLYRGSNSSTGGTPAQLANVTGSFTSGTTYHFKLVISGSSHLIYFNGATTPSIDIVDATFTGAGNFGLAGANNLASSQSYTCDNFVLNPAGAGTWQSASISLSSLGTTGNAQIAWAAIQANKQTASSVFAQTSLDGGTTWQTCTDINVSAQSGTTVVTSNIPQLPTGTNVSGKSLLVKLILSAANRVALPTVIGLYVRVCGSFGTVTGTRISPALSLTPVGYVASSNVMYNANIPTGCALTVATSQDQSTWTTVANSGAGASLSYWTAQPNATQDLFGSNTSANYTNTSKSGGSVATVTYDTANSRITLAGGSGALYLNNAITTADVDILCDTDESDAGGLVWRMVDTNNYYELGVYDASSSGGFTNQLRLYKVSSGTRSLLGSASSVTFTRTTFHRVRVTMQGGLINIYWDGQCVQSYLDIAPLGAGACGLRNDGGTSRYYQLWIQPLGTNLSGQVLYTKVTMSTSDPAMMPQLFTLVACVRSSSIATGATISQLHPVTVPFATYYSTEMDTLVQASGDFYWYVDKWRQMHFGPRLARPGAFPVQSIYDPAKSSGYLLYQPQVSVLSSADLFRNQQMVTDVTSLVTPPPEIKVADGSTTSWQMGYPLYSAPTILVNGQGGITVGVQGIDNNRQFYWQPGSPSISYDSTLPKLPAGTILSFAYVGQSTSNVILNNTSSQAAQAALELNSGIVAEIESALKTATKGMTTAQATTFGNGLLSRYGNNNTIELLGTTQYPGLAPGTTIPLFLPEVMSTWNAQLPIVKVATTAYQSQNGIVYQYAIDATTGPNLSQWSRVWF